MERKERPVIVCSGTNGRAVVYGYVDADASLLPGERVTLRRARMILLWRGGGLFGVAAEGPREGSRLTHAVAETSTTVHDSLSVSPAAAKALDAWPPA